MGINKHVLYYGHVHLDLVVATRKAFDVTSMYKSLFHRKCTVAAAHNMSVHVFSSIGNTYMKNLCGATFCLFTGQLKHFLLYLFALSFWNLKGFMLKGKRGPR